MKNLQTLARVFASLTVEERAALASNNPHQAVERFEGALLRTVNGPSEVLGLFVVEPSDIADAYDKFVYRDYYVDDVQVKLSFSRMHIDRSDCRNIGRHRLDATIGESHEEVPLPDYVDSLTMEQFDAIVVAFIEQSTVKMCPCCGKPMWANSGRLTTGDAHNGICHGCTMRGYDQASKDEAVQVAKQDVEMKAKGFTHCVDAWIHPGRGDDYSIAVYMNRMPTKADIARVLRKSVVKTDYSVRVL